MKRHVPVLFFTLFFTLFLAASPATAGFFNDMGNMEFYKSALANSDAKYFLQFDYGRMTYQADPNYPAVGITEYPIPQNPQFEKTIGDYFKAALGDRLVATRDAAAAVITIHLSGHPSVGQEVNNNISYNKVFETVRISMEILLARSGISVYKESGNEIVGSVDRKGYTSKGETQIPQFTSGLDALLSGATAKNLTLADSLKKMGATAPIFGKVAAVLDPAKKVLKVEYVSEKKVASAYNFVVLREKAADIPQTDWIVEAKSWEIVAVLGVGAGAEPNTYSCKIKKIKAGLTPESLVGLPLVINGQSVQVVLNAQDLLTGKENWK